MKTILIIYPHWVPSNLAGVHRPRLIANFLTELGWHPIVLTVKPEYYEEPLDPDIARTASKDIEVHYTDAYRIKKARIVGDIGLRAFPFIRRKALELIKSRSIDFIWIPIPAYYMAMMGRILHEETGIPYGIDYIDPWVEPLSNCNTLRAVLSQLVARFLEPIAVKKAALISGVSTPYYQPVLDRNFGNRSIMHAGMPYGFDPADHEILLDGLKMPWSDIPGCRPFVYAGAFLPNARLFIEALFRAMCELRAGTGWDPSIHLFFLGTGKYRGKQIADYAADFGLDDIVHENRERFPFLTILNFLSAASTVLVIGSTEKHYTASKIFQALLSKRPVFSVFHHESSAVKIQEEAGADRFLVRYRPEMSSEELKEAFMESLRDIVMHSDSWCPNLGALDPYSAKESARNLVDTIETCAGAGVGS